MALARQHEESARLLAANRVVAGQAYFHVGIAAECALKAFIMWKERLNSWPDSALPRFEETCANCRHPANDNGLCRA
jgi:hypothetical protein